MQRQRDLHRLGFHPLRKVQLGVVDLGAHHVDFGQLRLDRALAQVVGQRIDEVLLVRIQHAFQGLELRCPEAPRVRQARGHHVVHGVDDFDDSCRILRDDPG